MPLARCGYVAPVLVLYVLGSLGVVLLLGGLLLGDALDSVFDALDAGPGLTAALGAALTALGFGGALLAGPFGLLAGTLLGGGLGVGVGVAAFLVVRVALGGPDAPVTTGSLLGVFGTVVTRVPAGGLGEVVVPLGGSRVKLSARADEPLPAGTAVYVVEVLSSTSVVVQRADLLSPPALPPLDPSP
jgi:membrane protein implicated in regulation of membrane protease activity